MRGVVTGGSGFLGSHVADVLSERGHEITVVDLAPTSRHRFAPADLLDRDSLTAAFKGAEFVGHLAAVGDVYLAAEKPWLAAQANVVGSANVCEAALSAGVPKIVAASTWEVYGPPQYQPIDEAHPTAPDHPYSITKLAGERLSLAYGHLRKGLSVVELRLATAYGTRMRPNSVFSLFIDKALRGEPISEKIDPESMATALASPPQEMGERRPGGGGRPRLGGPKGAIHVDIGQGEQHWVVLADPEGNEFSVLSSLKPS